MLTMRPRLLLLAALLLTLVATRPSIAKDQPAFQNRSTSASETASPGPGSPSKSQTIPGPPELTARDPRVLLITAPDCEECFRVLIKLRSPGCAFEAMRSRGWGIGPGPHNHVHIVDREAVSELVKEAQIREYPAVVCVSEGTVIRGFKSGCTTPLDAWTFGWLLTGKNERPAGFVAESVRVASTGSYRL